MPGPSPILKARVPPEVLAQFRQVAQRRNLSESELLRTLVQREVAGRSAPEPAYVAEPGLAEADTETGRITVRMRAFLLGAVKERADAMGLAPSRWIAALVQSNLTRQPVLTDVELQAVLESNRELAALGRNLNQVAKALNEAFQETDRVRLELIQGLADQVKKNRSAIRSLVQASRDVWSGADVAHRE